MPHSVDVHVGNRIRHRRWLVGMTLQELAAKTGVNHQQIQKYEAGENRVSASRLWEVSAALGVPVSFFFEGMGDGPAEGASTSSTPAFLFDKEAANLVSTYYSIPASQRRRLLDLAKALAA